MEFAKKYISPITGKPIIDHVFLNTDLPSSVPQSNGHTNGVSPTDVGAGVGDGEMGVVEEEHHVTPGDIKWEAAKERAAKWIAEAGLTAEEGFDRVIEASGAEDCGLLGVAIAKQGAICTLHVAAPGQTRLTTRFGRGPWTHSDKRIPHFGSHQQGDRRSGRNALHGFLLPLRH